MTPTQRWHKYPPAKDNPGRVSEGEARDMEKRAELARQASHEDVIAYLRSSSLLQACDPSIRAADRNARKRQRRARKGK